MTFNEFVPYCFIGTLQRLTQPLLVDGLQLVSTLLLKRYATKKKITLLTGVNTATQEVSHIGHLQRVRLNIFYCQKLYSNAVGSQVLTTLLMTLPLNNELYLFATKMHTYNWCTLQLQKCLLLVSIDILQILILLIGILYSFRNASYW